MYMRILCVQKQCVYTSRQYAHVRAEYAQVTRNKRVYALLRASHAQQARLRASTRALTRYKRVYAP